ncbi:fimbria/pilus outer membrane usher protein [Erwinia sp. CPCC 100877]|nr:fimbria/pilus outer membrane usher protein [Erwinia sp. CPCC 100877]
MKSKEIKKHAQRVVRESKIALAVRHILIASLGVSFSVLAHSNVGDRALPTVGQSDQPENVKFNSAFIHGQSVDVSRYLQGNPAPAGEYTVQVFINGENRGKHKVTFNTVAGNVSARPCFNQSELTQLGIKFSDDPLKAPAGHDGDKEQAQCATIDKWIAGARENYQTGDFQLDLSVPQAYLVQYPRGYIDPNTWDAGVPLALLDYNANYYVQHSSGHYSSHEGRTSSGNLGLTTGLNFYDWRLRKRLNTSWTNGESAHTHSLLTYLQRDVPVLKSQLTLGDSITSGSLFDSLTVRGIQLQSDDRMLPDGLRYYTPLVRGIAESNARVRVTQRGQTLYETTVPPGPFEISDVGAMGFGGDLEVTIIEADGRQRTQVVPFAAPPMLLHEGVSRFGVVVGKLKDDSLIEEPGLAQGFYQYGLGNMYTLYGGGQVADNYTAFGLGNSFNTLLGGFSVDVTHARSNLGNGRSSSGNSYNVGFSKFIDPTSTDVTIAAYRYSSKGFYSLRDATLERYGNRSDDFIVDYRTRERFTVSVGQPLWNGGRINFSGNFYNYWDDRSSTSQYMLTYSKSERYFSWSASASRSYNDDGHDVNSFTLSVNIPLGHASITEKPVFSTLYSSVSRDNDGGSSFQMNAIGSQGEQNELSYGIGTSVNKAKNSGTQSSFIGNVDYNSSLGQFGSTLSVGNRTNQLSFSANGSLVAHSGGVTAGPRLGDAPFALVEAEGAEGAKLLNGYGSKIDANGYAIMPSLTPYHKNTVAVNTNGLPDTVDILEGESTVIPRMGAGVKVNIKTLVGNAVVLIVMDSEGVPLPIGTNIVNEGNAGVGIIGQGGMAFIRGWQAEKDNLYIKDSTGHRLCTIYADSNIAHKIASAQGAVTQVGVICH